MEKRVKSLMRRKRAHVISFIICAIIIIGLFFQDDITKFQLILPLGVVMYINTQMWDILDDTLILIKYLSDKEFREEYKKQNKIHG